MSSNAPNTPPDPTSDKAPTASGAPIPATPHQVKITVPSPSATAPTATAATVPTESPKQDDPKPTPVTSHNIVIDIQVDSTNPADSLMLQPDRNPSLLAISPVDSDSTSSSHMMPPSSRRKKRAKRQSSFVPIQLTAGLSFDKAAPEEFDNEMAPTTAANTLTNIRSFMPSLSDISSAVSTASKSVSDLSIAVANTAQKVSDNSKSAYQSAVEMKQAVTEKAAAASRAASETALAVSATITDVSEKVSAASKKMSETAKAVSATLSDVKDKAVETTNLAMETAKSAKQKFDEASQVASETATAVSHSVSSAVETATNLSKNVVDTATVVSKTVSDNYKKAAEVSQSVVKTAADNYKRAAEVSQTVVNTAAAVGESVSGNIKKATEVSIAAYESAAPVVSAVSHGVAVAAHSVSDVASGLARSSSSTLSLTERPESEKDVISDPPPASTGLQHLLGAVTQSTTLSNLSHSLSSFFSSSSTPPASSTPASPSKADRHADRELISLTDICPHLVARPEASYGSDNDDDLDNNNEGGPNRCAILGESINVYDCEIEGVYAQSQGTNSYESVVVMDKAKIPEKAVKHPKIGTIRKVQATTLASSSKPAQRVEEWQLRALEKLGVKPDEVPPVYSRHLNRLGDRENWFIDMLSAKLLKRFQLHNRHDLTFSVRRGFSPNGLPYAEIDIVPKKWP